MDDKSTIEKNLLDNELQNNLQKTVVTVFIIFSYFVGIIIAWITNQINWRSYYDVGIIIMFGSIFVGLGFMVLIDSYKKLKRIKRKLKNLIK